MTETKPETKAETKPETKSKAEAIAASTLERLTGRGEEALKRLSGELDKNPRAQDAKDRLAKFQRSTLPKLNIAVADELEELKKEVGRLEKRLAKLEKELASASSGHSQA